jgi:hypothetical protein
MVIDSGSTFGTILMVGSSPGGKDTLTGFAPRPDLQRDRQVRWPSSQWAKVDRSASSATSEEVGFGSNRWNNSKLDGERSRGRKNETAEGGRSFSNTSSWRAAERPRCGQDSRNHPRSGRAPLPSPVIIPRPAKYEDAFKSSHRCVCRSPSDARKPAVMALHPDAKAPLDGSELALRAF